MLVRSELVGPRSLCSGTDKAHQLFRRQPFGSHPEPSTRQAPSTPRKMCMCLMSRGTCNQVTQINFLQGHKNLVDVLCLVLACPKPIESRAAQTSAPS